MRAEENGATFENKIEDLFVSKNIKVFDYKKYNNDTNCLVKNYPYKRLINKTGIGRTEFCFVDSNLLKTRIECKFQESQGTASDKMGTSLFYYDEEIGTNKDILIFVFAGKIFSPAYLNETKRMMNVICKNKERIHILTYSEFVDYVNINV